ncbi:MAG: SurA N-terminal domain-containing protein [Legionellales bacterium]|nr:SurA N-terminal domain-containing protein [Legionellales bacterium]
MLQSIQKRAQGVILWIIVILICVTFAMWGVHNYLTTAPGQEIAAKVNGITITTQQVTDLFNRLQRQQQIQLGANYNPTPESTKALRELALDNLIDGTLLFENAKQHGLRISQNQLVGMIQNIPAFQVNQSFSNERFAELVRNMGFTPQQYLDQLQKGLLIEQMRSMFLAPVFSLPYQVQQAISLVTEKRDFSYKIIPAKQFASQVKIDEKQLQDYYQQHKNTFKVPEQVSINYIELSLPEVMKTINVSDKQLKEYYDNNLDNYTTPPRWKIAQILLRVPTQATAQERQAINEKAQQIYQQVEKGANFAKLAKQYSEDRVSAKQGGDLGWIDNHTKLPPSFLTVVRQLNKAGQVSKPTPTEYGISIIKLQAYEPQKIASYPSIYSQLKQDYLQQQAQQHFANLNEQLANLSYANSDSLKPAAKALGLTIQTSGLFSRDGGKDDFTKNPKVISAAFSNDVLTQHYNSDPLELSNNHVIVLRIAKHLPARIQAFAEVKDKIKELLVQKHMQELAQQQGQQLLDTLKKQNIANTKGWKSVKAITRIANQLQPEIVAHAFQLRQETPWQGFSLRNGDYVLIHLSAIHPGNLDPKTANAIAAYQLELERTMGGLDYELYVLGLKKHAKIVMISKSA